MDTYQRAATEMTYKQAKALAEETLRLSRFHASNDDLYSTVYYGAQLTKIMND